MTRSAAIAVALASLALTTACGSDEPEGTPAATTSVADSGGEESTPPASGGGTTTLLGVVGTEEDPDAFQISLTDESGEAVTSLPAGEYTIQVHDLSPMHNFHLTGGPVDESTAVDEVTDTTWEVTLEPGDYTFRCDPHPPMTGSFTVT